jgi:protocatechuate 4,5-dioxygenase, beta chain
MARIIGSLSTSHIPAIGNAIAKKQQNEPYWKPFFDAWPPVREWLSKEKPDVIVFFYNDHGLNFFLDKMPTFAVGACAEYVSEDEGWGIPTIPSIQGDQKLSWHIINGIVEDGFDPVMCQEMAVDHAITNPMLLMYPDSAWPAKIVPIAINSIQHPLPGPKRCYDLGRAVGKAIESYPEDAKVLLIGSGGLSHQLDGSRAGFINKPFDQECLEAMVTGVEPLLKYSSLDIVEKAGAQGVELMCWIAARAAMQGQVKEVCRTYHIPISNTASAVQLLTHTPVATTAKAA